MEEVTWQIEPICHESVDLTPGNPVHFKSYRGLKNSLTFCCLLVIDSDQRLMKLITYVRYESVGLKALSLCESKLSALLPSEEQHDCRFLRSDWPGLIFIQKTLLFNFHLPSPKFNASWLVPQNRSFSHSLNTNKVKQLCFNSSN